MKVCLINPPDSFTTDPDVDMGGKIIRDKSLGKIPPLNTLTVAAIFEREGVEVNLIDGDCEGLNYSQLLSRINKFSPDLIGFSLTTYNFRIVLEWINKVKKDTGLPIIVGGAQLGLYPTETLSHSAIDYAIVGEAELPLPQFIDAFRNGKGFDGIKSFGYKKNNEIVVDKTLQYIDNVDAVPYPALHLLNNKIYSNVLTRKKNFTAMISSRGCPYRCTFCDQKFPLFRQRSPQSFVDEIRRNYDQHGIREFDIYDSTFTAGRKRVREICDGLEKENLDVGFTIRSRVDSVNEKVLDALKRGGCHTIFYGIESADPELLKFMRKGISIDKIRKTIDYTKNLGIDVLGYFMLGMPGETKKTAQKTIDFALDLPLDYAQFTILLPMPNTEVYDYYREKGLNDYWADYTLNPNREQIKLIETEQTREELNRLVDGFYRKFYYRPRIIWKQMRKVRSIENFQRLTRSASHMLTQGLRPGYYPQIDGVQAD